jgi:outer membrane biosynthesis protein TonB
MEEHLAVEPTSRSRWILPGVVAAVVLLFVIGGAATQGIGGALAMLGLAALLLGAGAAITGRAHWAFIGSRRVAGLVAAAGIVALAAGGIAAPPTTPTASSSEVTPTPTSASRTTSAAEASRAAEAAAQAAEAAVEEAETAESAVPADGLAAGSLADDAARSAVTAAARTSALAALAAVEVKGRAPRTGYARDDFGSGWVDVDHNGCDTRNDVLARDLTADTFKPGTHNCVVLTGVLADPYSARTINFLRGQGTSDDVQIDHVVALSDAWQKGAQGLDAARRTAFANDPLNLLAVDGPLNMQKGDGDAATWLPPNKAYRCAYVARQVAVKVSYGLWMTLAEKNAIATVLSSCPNEPLPGGVVAQIPEPVAVPAPAPAPAPRPAPAPKPAPAPAPAPAPSVYYKNCDAARAAGAAPVHRGDPGYASHLDRDGDGIGCE